MKRLDLDFAASRRADAGWVVLGLALFIAFDAGMAYRDLALEAATLEARPRRAPRAPGVPAESMDAALREADGVARALLLPWDSLFRTLEQSADERVALLALQPDARKREIAITGEARDYDAVLAFVTRLESRHTLRDVHLVRHELREDDPQRPLAFSILASWEPAP